ncbi:MAG: MCE family protein [Candidatus Omnitrophica bacterium]|nr:MCE family protein [Candidatus Omnitrophota bacterium]
MSKKVNKTLMGVFVIGALALLLVAIVVFGSGELFKQTNKFVLYFDGSVKGLAIGAPVMFRGVSIGTVRNISLIYDAKAGTIMLPVIVEIEQGRIKGAPSFGEVGGDQKMIALGLRAKLEVQSFLTGQLMISFDFYPDQPAKLRAIINQYPELPTLPTSTDIFELMNEIPIKEISKNLEATSQGINRLVNSPDLQRSLYEMQNTFQETKEAMRSFHLLTEYLEQHPESILKGKSVMKGE